VGYATKQAPLSFKNSYNELVGFDIAYAHQLAYDLGCQLQLVPLNYQQLCEQMDQGLFDIGMSAISMNESRIQNSYFSTPYLSSPIIFVMKEDKKRKFKKSAYIFGDKTLKIGAIKGTSYEELLPKLFPDHPHVLLDSYNQLSQSEAADILIWNEFEAIAWILKHRNFRIMFPSPAIGQDTLCYMIKQGDNQFLEFINNWLILKKNEGFFNHQYNLWIQGKTDSIEVKDRRWSVIRNVLHLVD
jgi:cyclohexadienyl dehydratase